MKKSKIPVGQMFLRRPATLSCDDTRNKTQAWVKVSDEDGISVFVKNDAMVKVSIKMQEAFRITDEWSISDNYYEQKVKEGEFVPIDDLGKADEICEQLGWEKYEIDLGF